MADEKPKRRLPVLQQNAPEPESKRPPIQAALLGAVATLIVWLLLSALLSLLQLVALSATVANLLALGMASVVAGAFTERMSPDASARHAALGASLASFIAFLVAFSGTMDEVGASGALVLSLVLTLAALVGIASAAAVFGFRFASRRNRPRD
jgi:putative flippase GtrA